jgi:pilus assembly protein CpaE
MLMRTLAETKDTGRDKDGTAPIGPGKVLAFMGAKGGIGTSSLCLNLVQMMSHQEDSRSVVLDLVLPLGYLARITGAQSPYDVVELTSQLDPKELTPNFLRTSLPVPKSWNFHLVPGARDPNQGAKLDADRLAPLVQSLRAGFGRVVVDLGRTLSPLTMLILRQTEVAIMVFSPEPAVVGATAAVLRYLEDQGINRDRFFLMSNRPLGTEDMSKDDLAAILTHQVDAAIPHLGSNLALTNRLHAPLELRFPQEAGTNELRQAAEQIFAKQAALAERAKG